MSKEEITRYVDEVNENFWYQKGGANLDDKPVLLCEDALAKALSVNYSYGAGRSYLSLGMGAFIIEHNVQKSLKLLNEALSVFKDLGDKKWVANTLITIAIMNNSAGNPEQALYNAIKGFEWFEENAGDTADHTRAYYVIGTVYKDLKKYNEAEAYYKTGIKITVKNDIWSGRIYTGLSNIYNERGQYEEALELAMKSLEILKAENNKVGESRALSDIGIIYKKLKKYNDALKYFSEALKIREELNITPFILGSLLDMAGIYIEQNNNTEAISFFLKAEVIALETNHQVRLAGVFQNLITLYKQIDNYLKALEYSEKYIQLTIELNNKERETKITNLQGSLLQEKEQEIERLRNVELKNAYDLITEKNQEITDSIHYAKRIQKALMASENILSKNLSDHFIMYKPKAIVSGDFYWAASLQNGNFALVTADSTGHGVPGAFMSLLSISFLNESINERELVNPAEILDHARERIIQSLAEDGSIEGGKDGMDCILCCFDFKNLKLHYAAANNSFYILRAGVLITCPADKMPVGKSPKENDPFTLHTVELQKGDVIYTLTDGFTDQFGGPKGKKFRYRQLEEILVNNAAFSMEKQQQILEQKFDEWKGNLEQIDDVLLIGIKI
jgi:serine phosphatase RsbU (regulator of sigma subunit)